MNVADRDALRRDLVSDEGVRLSVYPDHLGFWTIGVGRLVDERKGGGISPDEAAYLLNNDIKTVLDDLSTFPWFAGLDGVRMRAVCNMRFQLGPMKFRGFQQMIAALERQDYEAAADAALDSKYARVDAPARAQRVAQRLRTGLS